MSGPIDAKQAATTHPPWTVRKVATAFAVSTAWVYKMADQQQIPHVRRGSTILFPYAELVAWFNGKRSPR